MWMVKLHVLLMFIEACGLVVVSVVDIEDFFVIHAAAYAVWVISFNLNMLLNTILHHNSGVRKLTNNHDKVFNVKVALFVIGYPLSLSTGITYFFYIFTCNGQAYAMFSVAEYMIVGFNSLFYFLLIWELPDSKVEIYMKHDHHHITRNDITL